MYYANNDVRLEEQPRPAVNDGEILVKIEASGICGTDCLEWYRIHRVPLVLGHEIAGTIAEVGKGVKGYKVGDRVSVSHHVPCGECRFCKDGHESVCDTLRKTNFFPGGFSEYVRVPAINVEKGVYKLPDNVSLEEATFIEPLACVLRGQRLANFKRGRTVLVIGSGISGLLHIKLAKANGIDKIFSTDISQFRLDAAVKSGALSAFDARKYSPELLKEKNEGFLADRVVLSAGANPAIAQGLKSIERGGVVLFFAAGEKDAMIPVSMNDLFWRNEVTLTSSYAGSPEDHREALKLISSRKVDVRDMITHRLSLKDAGIGFKLVAEARDSIKVIIEPQK
jgi:L-iditol 2-dehydrogenase